MNQDKIEELSARVEDALEHNERNIECSTSLIESGHCMPERMMENTLKTQQNTREALQLSQALLADLKEGRVLVPSAATKDMVDQYDEDNGACVNYEDMLIAADKPHVATWMEGLDD